MLSSDFNHTYARLVSAWERHEQLSRSSDIAALLDARIELDELRYEMAVLRRFEGI